MSYTDFFDPGKLEKIKDKDKVDKRKLLLKIIDFSPGIRYRELLRITNLNNGTLSHHLSTLEKSSIIKKLLLERSNITRYYPSSVPNEETILLGFLKIKTTKELIVNGWKKNLVHLMN